MAFDKEVDVCILGAGPAGLTTAMFLAKKGISSTVIEKENFPRDKICGDAFSGKVAWVLNKLDKAYIESISKESFQLPSWGVNFYGTKNNELKVPFKLIYDAKSELAPGFIAKRKDFDNYLFSEAKKIDLIEIIEDQNMLNYERIQDGIRVSDKSGSCVVSAKILVACDGAYSKAAKDLMQFEVKNEHNALGIRTYYEGVSGLDKEGYIELHFLKELLPGYFWIFPLPNGGANVGAGIRTDLMRKNRINFKKVFNQIITEHPVISKRFKNATLSGGVKTYGLPLGSEKRPISSERLLLVGDAGGLIDPFSGEGIGNAMIAGMYAADQVEKSLKSNDFSATHLAEYDAKVYGRLWSELALSKKMQELSRFPWLFNFVVNKARRNKELQEMISCMFESVDIRNKLKNPMFYLRLIFK